MNIIIPVVVSVSFLAFYLSLIGIIFSSRATPTTIFGLGFFAGFIALIVICGALSLTALILFLVGMNRLSKHYNEPSIINNPIKALIIQIITAAAFIAIYFAILFYVFGSAIGNLFTPSNVPTYLFNLIAVYVIIAVVSLAIAIYCGLLYKRAFDKLAAKSNVDTFSTAGLLFLIGSIIPIVGWIAWIFAALGYHKLASKQATALPTPYTPAPSTQAKKRCVNCGAENPSDAFYCGHCGRQL